MKKFIFQVLILVALLFILALLVDYVITKGLRRVVSDEFAVWNDIYGVNNMDNDLVVLGASTAWTSYNTYIMDSLMDMSTYNLGIDGHPWYMYKVRYETYRKVAPKPKFIIINLDKMTFQESLDNPYMRQQFLPYPKLMWCVRNDKDFSFFDLCLPYYRYIGYPNLQKIGASVYFSSAAKRVYDNYHKGYCGQYRSWELRDSVIFMGKPKMSYSKIVKEDMEDFIKTCQGEGITVVLCRYPLFIPYLQRCDNISQFKSLCEEICDETGALYLDYSNMAIAGDTSFFYNPTHLNVYGAERFTIQLVHDLDSLGIK